MTKATYRKKALPFLLKDFEGRCAYCLDPGEFRHPSQTQVDHYDCKIRGRRRHRYRNLMLACAACNLSKHDKPITNPLNKEQRLLNCTEETEFPEHIVEGADGRWEAKTKAASYHLAVIGLTEPCHQAKRRARRQIAEQILGLCTQAIEYRACNPVAIHNQVVEAIGSLLEHLENFPPLVTGQGLMKTRDWLKSNGVDVNALFAPQPSGKPVAAA